MALSKRLERIAACAEGSRLFADVGCDHGLCAAEILRRNPAARAICMDIGEGPLSSAAKTMERQGYRERTTFLLSDGLRCLALTDQELTQGERSRRDRFFAGASVTKIGQKADGKPPDCIILSGMGGTLMRDILQLLPTNGVLCDEKERAFLLEEAKAFLQKTEKLILSPQSEPEALRHFLIDELQFSIEDEEMLYEDGHYYVILIVRPDQKAVKEAYQEEWSYVYGIHLLQKRDPVFRKALLFQKKKLEAVLSGLRLASGEAAGQRCAELSRRLEELEAILSSYEK